MILRTKTEINDAKKKQSDFNKMCKINVPCTKSFQADEVAVKRSRVYVL